MRDFLAILGGVTLFWLAGMAIGLCLHLWRTRGTP